MIGLERTEVQDEADNALIADDTNTEIIDARTMHTECSQDSTTITETCNGDNTVNSTDNDSNNYVELYPNTNSIISTTNSVSDSNFVNQEISDLNNQVAESCFISEPTDQQNTVSIWKQHCDEFSSQRPYVQSLTLHAKEDLKMIFPGVTKGVLTVLSKYGPASLWI